MRGSRFFLPAFMIISLWVHPSFAWFDETHIMIGRVSGYSKWFNAAGADMVKLKAPWIEVDNHYANNPPGTVVTPEMVLSQAPRYDQPETGGHLYGAIVEAVRNFIRDKKDGRYAEYHLAFCLHYVGDLSQPLHNIVHDDFNKRNHSAIDGVVNGEVLDNPQKIKIYPVAIDSEETLATEIARIANLSLKLGYRLQKENRLLTKEEAYEQLSHSASLFKGILGYVSTLNSTFIQ